MDCESVLLELCFLALRSGARVHQVGSSAVACGECEVRFRLALRPFVRILLPYAGEAEEGVDHQCPRVAPQKLANPPATRSTFTRLTKERPDPLTPVRI